MIEATVRMRLGLVTVAIVAGFLLVAGGLSRVVLVQGTHLAGLAHRQYSKQLVLPERRGIITDRNGGTLASSTAAPSVFAHPSRLPANPALASDLAGPLGLPAGAVSGKLRADRSFVWLRRTVTPHQAEAVSALKLAGVGIAQEERRYYPHGTLAAHILGFTGIDMQGLAGTEFRFDSMLRGSRVSEQVERDALGHLIACGAQAPEEAREGAALELAIDAPLQFVTEQALFEGVERARAKGGSALVLDPWTGEILALANLPTFDPNTPERAPAAAVRNRAVTDMYEPGSTLKPFLVAAALESGVVTPDSAFYCEDGRMSVTGRVIHDHHPHGWLSVREIVQVSSNIGAAKIVQKLGAKRYREYLSRFGFGARLGVDLPAEAAGLVAPAERWSAIRTVNAAFGQGVAVTPLQMAAAFGVFASGGCLFRPHVVRRVIGAGGDLLREARPEKIRCPISRSTALQITAMLEKVVQPGGTAELARIEGFAVAGKTGTAQKVDRTTGRYSSRAVVASFGGYLPSRNPRAVILVVIDEPSRGRFGGMVAAPVFRTIAVEAMRRLQVAPDAERLREVRPVASSSRRASRTAAGMPSFLGMSLRQALVAAGEAGWQVKVKGSGYVKAQAPRPGAPASPGRTLVLSLAPPVGLP